MKLIETTREFFDRYRKQNVDAMVDLFASDGEIDYLPAKVTGPAGVAGRAIWSGLIQGFPDLTNEVKAVYASDDGQTVVAEVLISGTQAEDAFGIPNKGLRYEILHCFILHGNDEGKIKQMRVFWDNAEWFRSLGKTTL